MVPDTIGFVKVDLVGCLSDKSVMGHLGVVVRNVKIDQLLELREAFEGMQVQPLMTERTSECLDHGVAEADLHLGKQTADDAVGHQSVDSGIHVFDAGVGNDGRRLVEILGGLFQDFAHRSGREPFRKAPRQDPAREVVDDGMQVAFRVIQKSDDREVDVPVLVWVRGPDSGLGLFGIRTATRTSPPTLPDELRPGRRRRKDPADSLGIKGQSSNGHMPILRSGNHFLDRAHLGGGKLRWMRAGAA